MGVGRCRSLPGRDGARRMHPHYGFLEHTMKTIDTNQMMLARGRFASDPSVRFRANFALHGGKRMQNASVVMIDLDPGKAVGTHTDNAEQVLLVLEGEVELMIGDERETAGRGMMAVVPPMVPHSMCNIGDVPARVVGYFASPTVVTTFAEAFHPRGSRELVFGDRAMLERIPELLASGRIAAR